MNYLGYQLIFCFENLLRKYIEEKVEGRINSIDASYIEQATENMRRMEVFSEPDNVLLKDILSYLHLGQLLDIISSKKFRETFDNKVWKQEKAKLSLISLRNDIMHSRIIFESEVEDLKEDIMFLLDALKDRKYKSEFESMLEQEYRVCNICIPFVNYPLGKDFTRLVGRDNDIKTVLEKLNYSIPITVAGMGGLGKSALVLQLIEDIIISPNPKFKKIFFMSFKDSYFDGVIRDLSKPISNYDELITKLFHLMDLNVSITDKEFDMESIVIEQLFKEPVLLILDNLETEIINANYQKFLNLARKFSRNYISGSKLLITSRNGLGQIEDKYDLTILDRHNTLELIFLITERKIKVTDDQAKWIEKYCEGNPLQIKTLAIVLKQAQINLANLIVQYENRQGSLARKVFEQKEAFLSFCFDNTICTLSKQDQILYTIVCEVCSRIGIYLLNYEFFDFIIDHLELVEYDITSFEPNNFIRLTLLYFDSNNNSKYFKLNISAMQYLTHGRELANHYNRHNLIRDNRLYSIIDSTVRLIQEIMHHSTEAPTINTILEGLYNRKYLSTQQDVYLFNAYNVNPSLQSLIKYLDNTNDDILSKTSLIDLLHPREMKEMSSKNIRNQNILISKFLHAILLNRDSHLFVLREKLESIKQLPFLSNKQEFLDYHNKRLLCKVLLKLKVPYEALVYLRETSEDDDIKFEVFSKIAEEARKTNKLEDTDKYFLKCEQLLQKGVKLRDYEMCRYYLYYGKYLYEKNPEEGIAMLSNIDSFKIRNVSLLSFILESLIIRAEHYKAENNLNELKKMSGQIRQIGQSSYYKQLYSDKQMMFESRICKLSS